MAESIFDRDLNVSNFRIKNVGAAIEPNDAISKSYFDSNQSKMFNHIEGFDLTEDTLKIELANPTDIYSSLVIHDGLIKSPSSQDGSGNTVIRDYQILTYPTYSEIQYYHPVANGTHILVVYNTVSNS